MPPGFRSDEINAMVSSGMVSMQNQAAYAQGITPAGYGAPVQPMQPMQPAQPTQSPYVGGLMSAAQIMGGYGAVQNALPGSSAQNQAMDQLQMQAVGLIAGPSSPFPLNQVFKGMQQQYGVNRMLEQNFQFVRPGMGRGFTPSQQLQVGAGMRGIAAETPFVGMPELTQLMQQGAQMGQYQGIRDVQGAMKRTREMLKDWQNIATELNLTLQEAAKVSNQLKQQGVFRTGQQATAIEGIATTAAVSGQSVQGLLQAGAMGAQMGHRFFGQGTGVRSQAAGAMRASLGLIGTAQQAGVLSEADLFEATGMTGEQGQQAFAQRLNVASAKFLKKGRGKITMAAVVDPDTMEIDTDAVNRLMTGNMSLNEIERRAQQNTAKMGYVKWNANKARLGAAFTQETGGLGSLALMRSWLGEDAMQDTDRARLILSRKTGLSQSEVDVAMDMMRELPMMQNRMRNETRMIEKQRAQAQRWNQYGPEAQMERKKAKIREAVLGPIDDLRSGIERAFREGFDEAIEEEYRQNQRTVSEATRDVFERAARGQEGAQQRRERGLGFGTRPGALESFKAGTAGLSRLDETLRAPTLSMRGFKERGVAGTWRAAMGDLTKAATPLVERVGGFLGGRAVGDELDKVEDQILYNAYTTGNFGVEALKKLGFEDPMKFVEYTVGGDDRVARIMVGKEDMQTKIEKIKELEGVDTDEQARAIAAKVSKTEDYLSELTFIGPKGQSSERARTIAEAQEAYIESKLADSSVVNQEEAKAGASAWLADAELQQMAKKGADVAEIKQKAIEKYGSTAGSFVEGALGLTDEQMKLHEGAREAVRQAKRLQFGRAGEATWALEGAEFIERMYASEKEDFQRAQDEGGFFKNLGATEAAGAKKGATRKERRTGRAAAALRMYGTTMAKEYDLSDPEQARLHMREMQDVNETILSMPAGDLEQFVELARQNDLDAVANNYEALLGKKREFQDKSEKYLRRQAIKISLGEDYEQYKDIFEEEGVDQEQRLGALVARGAITEEQKTEFMDMSKKDLEARILGQKLDLMQQEQTAVEDKKAEAEASKQEQRQAWRATRNMEQDLNILRRTVTAGGGIKVKIAGVVEPDDGTGDVGKVTGGMK